VGWCQPLPKGRGLAIAIPLAVPSGTPILPCSTSTWPRDVASSMGSSVSRLAAGAQDKPVLQGLGGGGHSIGDRSAWAAGKAAKVAASYRTQPPVAGPQGQEGQHG
jgi:hypothetical protein